MMKSPGSRPLDLRKRCVSEKGIDCTSCFFSQRSKASLCSIWRLGKGGGCSNSGRGRDRISWARRIEVRQSSIINHQSSIINHQPSTINHQSSIINHQSSIINHQPSTINPSIHQSINPSIRQQHREERTERRKGEEESTPQR